MLIIQYYSLALSFLYSPTLNFILYIEIFSSLRLFTTLLQQLLYNSQLSSLHRNIDLKVSTVTIIEMKLSIAI